MKKILYIATALVTLGFTSCDIDDVENVTEMSQSVYPASDEDADAIVAAIYQNLNSAIATPSAHWFYLACLAGDDQLGGGGEADYSTAAMDLLLNYGSDMTNYFWETRYKGIARANNAITTLSENESVSESTKNTVIGEAKFLRAYYYYELASMYGNIPLAEDEGLQGDDITEVWKQILQDLRDACEVLEDVRNTDGHVDKYTAEAMLARAWLFYTGFFCNGTDLSDLVSTTYNADAITSVTLRDETTLTKDEVIDYIEDCVNNSGYSLVDDYRELWAYTNKYTVEDYSYTAGQGLTWAEDDGAANPESMFAVKFNRNAGWSTTDQLGYSNEFNLYFGMRLVSDYALCFPFGQGWGAGPVAPNLVSEWTAAEPSDMRREATICDLANDCPNYSWGSDFVQETGYFNKKLSAISCISDDSDYATSSDSDPDHMYVCCFEALMYDGTWTNGVNFQTSNIHDLVLIRYADALLMWSELTSTVNGINQVRARAGLDAISSYSLSALQNERRWELACEGIRWNDLRRWHIAATNLAKQQDQAILISGTWTTNTAHGGGYASRYNATAGFQKMPDSQVALGSVAQNEGWTGSDSNYSGW